MRRIVLQSIAGTCPALDLTAPFARKYAESIGAEYIQERLPNAPICDAFAKLSLDYWATRADQTLWIDADVICLPGAPDIFANVPEDRIAAFAHEGDLHQAERIPWPLFGLKGYGAGYCNTGVMVWPRMAAGLVRDALEIIRSGGLKDIDKSRHFYEQTALNIAFERSGINIQCLDYRFNAYLADAEIADRWADDIRLHPVADAWFVHFAGGAHTPQGYPTVAGNRHSQTERAEWMEKWMKAKGLI